MKTQMMGQTPSQYLIREIITQCDYSQSRIARESGISRRTLTSLYHGKTADPSHRVFRKLLALYCQLFFLSTPQTEKETGKC